VRFEWFGIVVVIEEPIRVVSGYLQLELLDEERLHSTQLFIQS